MKGKARKATFSFSATEASSTFTCKLDKKVTGSCRSPKAYTKLKPGKHTFTVFATDAAGNADKSPAIAKFKITKPKKKSGR